MLFHRIKNIVNHTTIQKLLKILLWLLICLVILLILLVISFVILVLFFRDQLYLMLLDVARLVFGNSPENIIQTILQQVLERYILELFPIPSE